MSIVRYKCRRAVGDGAMLFESLVIGGSIGGSILIGSYVLANTMERESERTRQRYQVLGSGGARCAVRPAIPPGAGSPLRNGPRSLSLSSQLGPVAKARSLIACRALRSQQRRGRRRQGIGRLATVACQVPPALTLYVPWRSHARWGIEGIGSGVHGRSAWPVPARNAVCSCVLLYDLLSSLRAGLT